MSWNSDEIVRRLDQITHECVQDATPRDVSIEERTRAEGGARRAERQKPWARLVASLALRSPPSAGNGSETTPPRATRRGELPPREGSPKGTEAFDSPPGA